MVGAKEDIEAELKKKMQEVAALQTALKVVSGEPQILPRRGKLSPAGRAAIRAAVKRRWAVYKKKHK